MIYEMRGLALTSFILSAVEVSHTFCSTLTKLCTSSFFFFFTHLFHICSQDATFKISRSPQFKPSQVPLMKNEQEGNSV